MENWYIHYICSTEFFQLGYVILGQFDYLPWEYHQNHKIFRPILPFKTDIGVDIEILIFRYSIFIKFHTDTIKHFQSDTKYSILFTSAIWHQCTMVKFQPTRGRLLKENTWMYQKNHLTNMPSKHLWYSNDDVYLLFHAKILAFHKTAEIKSMVWQLNSFHYLSKYVLTATSFLFPSQQKKMKKV